MRPKKITLEWQGEHYSAEATLQFIATIEEVLPVGSLFHYLSHVNESNYSKIAMAFAAALRYAGCEVSDETVYETLFEKQGIHIVSMLKTIAQLTFPPQAFAELFPQKEVAEDSEKSEKKS